MGAAAFSAFICKMFRQHRLSMNVITYLDDAFIQTQTKQDMYKVLDTNHQILLK